LEVWIWDLFVLTPDLVPLRGKRVTVMGLGLFGGGVAAARWLVREGARVTVTDLRGDRDLRESLDALAGLPVTCHLGGHVEDDFRAADLVVRSPAVPYDNPFLQIARAARVPVDTEMNLFWKRCRAPILAVTGSNGKTTTTALCGEILKRISRRPPAAGNSVWVGGNIGVPLIEKADAIAEGDFVCLEMSSFQLEDLAFLRKSPRVAVVMNLTPNHLDRHGTMEAYAAAKQQIVRDQGPDDAKVLNLDDPSVSGWSGIGRGRTRGFTLETPAPESFGREGEVIRARVGGRELRIDATGRRLPGWFNLQNMIAAAAATWEYAGHRDPDAWRDAAESAFREFPGVEHRLEFVAEKGGVKYYNDSIATNPESTLAALDALPGPFVLIAGGYDKKLPFDTLAKAVAAKVKHCILIGQTADAIERLVRAERGITELHRAASLDEAVLMSQKLAQAGATVLLSPACASFDMFRNFAERGRMFKERVQAL
jgi:UDP-N-acetylmuramoylalanine--D-glutamate ligase